jgi:hypothetical protein
LPHINWKLIPDGIRQHLYDRLRTRELSQQDIVRLTEWISTNPEVPDGPWWKDFGSFKLTGDGKYPKTFLTGGQAGFGKRL